jgi:hypothetical protein
MSNDAARRWGGRPLLEERDAVVELKDSGWGRRPVVAIRVPTWQDTRPGRPPEGAAHGRRAWPPVSNANGGPR